MNRGMNFAGGAMLARNLYNNRAGLRNAIVSRFRSSFGRNKKMAMSGIGVTSQYDRKQVYRKKSMPRYKRKAWRRFKNKVLAVSTKQLGSNTIVRNNLVQSTMNLVTGNDRIQNSIQLALYPVRSTDPLLDDLNQIMSDTRLNTTSKVMFCSGILDLTIRVQSLFAGGASVSPNGNPTFSVELDIYEISMRGATGQSGEATDLASAFNIAHTDTGTIPGFPSGLTRDSRGWTPWDGTSALSQHKIKIWKKTKYFLSSEQTATYQIRDPKTHFFTKDSVPGASSANWPGVTRWLYIIWNPVPGYNYVASPNNDNVRVNIGVTRKYLYKLNEDDTDYDAFNL